jgi:DNA-binding transcriptional ArsR family regulator
MSGMPLKSASMKAMKEVKQFTLREAQSVRGRQEPNQQAQLWGRPLGREVRAEIEEQLTALAPGETLIVDLTGVEVMDHSFAGEVFGRLLGSLAVEHPGRVLLLTGLSNDVRDDLSVTLAAMELTALALKSTRTWELLGKAGETDRETLAALQRLKEATAPQIAEVLDLKLPAANGRLKKLSEAGMIVRMRVTAPTGGEQYAYRWPV